MYNRKNYQDTEYVKRPKHASVSFHVNGCQDCGVHIHSKAVINRYGGRCRRCWSSLHVGVVTDVVVG
ncbi:hypothetical protein KDA_25400 [Dictyobacter alpinus]|uniref:Uncharacterized protein n=1 Tax=Dictyobacter alpinus TaxID=2014873 RepID=A0A402B6T7_9CHLR|nr:hypothetical protein [Dictyobacter alpinus]GCE27056.1 hypothetical protein KDA_25400 [Dictyobacter alpinus]